MDDMIRHCQAVRRGSPNVFIARDMPYMSYQVSDELAIANACRFVREADGAGLIRDSSVVRPGMQKK
jgi:3-methyl-2-oxobutanoate hydroxymethyltransferase